jgi:DNA-binding response OmpR family regulator
MNRILVIEDDPAIRRGLSDNLTFESYDVDSVASAEDGYKILENAEPDLVILDVMLPGMSGYDLCRRLRREGFTVPILMLTARGDEFDRVMGLDMGADDYVTKPFSILELLARVRALLRRAAPDEELQEKIEFGDVRIDFRKFETEKNGSNVSLSRKEYGLLQLLASRAGEVVTRDELLDVVWGADHFPSTRTVDNHVSMIRAKLENTPSDPDHLITVHGVGYKLVI